MKRGKEYIKLTDGVLKGASKEQSALMKAQWEILGARYTKLAEQSKKVDENTTIYDPITRERMRGP